MQSFEFFFSLRTALIAFELTEMLSKTLQSAAMTVAAGANAAQKTCSSLEHYREDLEWQRLWQCCQDQARALRVDDPVVPRVHRGDLMKVGLLLRR